MPVRRGADCEATESACEVKREKTGFAALAYGCGDFGKVKRKSSKVLLDRIADAGLQKE
jgi:hypothetical protein